VSELDFDIVVLDGANIIHDNLKTLEPKRLLSAIEHCVGKGWETVAALKHGTYTWARHHHHELEEGDFEILQKMIDEGKIDLITQKDEDIFWIDTALEDDGYIITEDTFEDKEYDGTIMQRERSLYPDRDWEEIDQRTLKYSFIRGKFRCPNLPKKPDYVPDDSLEISQEENVRLKRELEEERAKNRALTAKMKTSTTAETDHDDQIVNVFENLLGEGGAIKTAILNEALAKSVLGLEENNRGDWPEGWDKDLKVKLGFPRTKKFTSFIEDISQIVTKQTDHRIEFNPSRTMVKKIFNNGCS